MITIYREQPSESANALADALDGCRVRRERHIYNYPGHPVVFWGDFSAQTPAGPTLNRVPVGNKVTDAEALTRAGVPTITISRTQPPPHVPATDPAVGPAQALYEAAGDFADLPLTQLRSEPYRAAVRDLGQLVARLREQLDQPTPATTPIEWLVRSRHHVGGNDLLYPEDRPVDYWVKREEIVREYRVHSFLGRSIRAGIKVPRENFQPLPVHPWIRSWDAGWRISYDGQAIRQRHRDIAHAAVRALGLDFGAVDIGERPDGSLFVLEVNRAPGIEAGTIEAYTRAIRAWAGDRV